LCFLGESDHTSLVFTEENSRVVNELVETVKGSSAVYREIKEHLQEMVKHLDGTRSLETDFLSKEEINLMQQRWSGLAATIGGMDRDLLRIETRIHMGPDLIDAVILSILQDRQGADASNNSNQLGDPPTRQAITDGTTSAVASSEATPSGSRIHLWRQKWWRWVVSFLSLGCLQ
jgi:hypothetical protein